MYLTDNFITVSLCYFRRLKSCFHGLSPGKLFKDNCNTSIFDYEPNRKFSRTRRAVYLAYEAQIVSATMLETKYITATILFGFHCFN